MAAVGKLIVLLFVLSFGKSPDALREFKHIKGEWIIVSGEERGERVRAETLAKKVIFLSSAQLTKQPANSITFSGQLKSHHTPKLLELASMSIMMELLHKELPGPSTGIKTHPAKSVGPIKETQKSFAIYQVTGDTMKLLLTRGIASSTEPPKEFVTTKEGGELLLELRRKPLDDASRPDKGRK